LPLVGEQWSIGSDAEQDLALRDPGVEQLHCRLRRQGDGWALNAADGSICDEEGHRHATAELTPNRAFVLGSVWLCVSPAEDAWPSVPALIPPPAPEPQPEPAVSAPPLEKNRIALTHSQPHHRDRDRHIAGDRRQRLEPDPQCRCCA
jgi:type III secretion protein D